MNRNCNGIKFYPFGAVTIATFDQDSMPGRHFIKITKYGFNNYE